MRVFTHIPGVYAYIGSLPRGCQLCIQGAKLVIFVTGLCDERCFYCPVSRLKLGRDVVFVDEEPAKTISDVVEEAERIGAHGASITGGDPLLVLGRTVKIVRLLKEYGGPGFHIHLYTSGRYATANVLRELERAGLDEIRFHPVEPWMAKAVEKAVKIRRYMSVGVEVPVFPDRVDELKRLVKWLDSIGADFINLNEVEVSPDNMDNILARGYSVEGYVVRGSYEAGVEIVRWSLSSGVRLSVHFCPARYKDAVQMRVRLIRKALRTATCFEEVEGDGSIRIAVVEEKNSIFLKGCCMWPLGEGLVAVDPRCRGLSRVRHAFIEVQPSSRRVETVARIARLTLSG